MKKENKNEKKKNKVIKTLVILISMVVLAMIIAVIIVLVSKTSSSKNSVGNTIGNIRNYGYLVDDEDYLYFMSPNDSGTAIGIRKISKDDLTGDSEVLIEDNWQIVGLNYMDGYLYFITMADPEDEDDEDTVDNKIYKMKTDGTEATVINDNDFNNDCYEIYVVKNKLYYIGTDECIYYMDLDGSNRTKLNDNASGYIGITEDYIFFNKITETDEETGEAEDYVTYMMNLDGSDEHAVVEGEKLYNINIIGDYIYYVTKDRYVSKINLDGTDGTMLSDETAYNMNATEDGIYYLNYYQVDGENAGVAIYKMDLDGSNVTQLTKLDETSEMLCEFDNWLFFSDSDDEEGRFELVSKDGKQTVVLYSLDLSIYEEDEETEDAEDVTEEATEAEEITEDTEQTTDE